jgi:hypothetical protein
MALTFTVNGASYSVGVQHGDVQNRLGRVPIYRKFCDQPGDFVGRVGTAIQFTNRWEPNTILAGVTDNASLALRDPTQAPRTVQLLTYGEGREWSSELLQRSQATIEKGIKEGLADTVANSINAAIGASMLATNTYYWCLGALGAEAYGMNYAAAWPGATATRNISEMDLIFFQTLAGLLGWKVSSHGGLNVVVEHLNRQAIMQRMVAFALAGPPASLEKTLEKWPPGHFVAWINGTAIWYDNTGFVLRSNVVGAGAAVLGEGFAFGANPVIEACVHKGVQMSTYTSPDSRHIRAYIWEEGVGWTLQVNSAGLGAVPPADINSTCLLRFGDA